MSLNDQEMRLLQLFRGIEPRKQRVVMQMLEKEPRAAGLRPALAVVGGTTVANTFSGFSSGDVQNGRSAGLIARSV